MALILIEYIVIFEALVAFAVENPLHELYCEQLVLVLRVRDALMVLASLERQALLITVLLLRDQFIEKLFAAHFG